MNPLLANHLLNPLNVGSVVDADGEARAGSLICGAVVSMSIKIDDCQILQDAKFKAAGCSRLVAACSLLTERVKGMTTADAGAFLRPFPERILESLGPAAIGQQHCALLAGQALLSAIRKNSDARRAEWSGDDVLICSCFGISEKTIEREVETHYWTEIEEITKACNAGAGCGSCHTMIQDIIDNAGQANMSSER